jgi:signal-transduction protein with cAMP-binding, CBS, and nucleotidyltransferase domain
MLEELRNVLARVDREAGLQLLGDIQQRIAREEADFRVIEARRRQLFAELESAEDYGTLHRIEETLTRLEMERFLTVASVPALQHSCTDYRNRLATRTIELVTQELAGRGAGPPPLPFALVSMGSDGREEQSLITDQDYLLVYDDGGGEKEDEYFREFSELLVERLAEVGFHRCSGGIMPSNPTWRGSRSQWRLRLLAIVRYEYEAYARDLMDLIVMADARFVAGDRAIGEAQIELIRDFEQNYFQVIWGMARAAAEMKIGLRMFGRFWTDREGEYRGLLNLKLLGWAPLVMNIRILAVSRGLTVTNTLQRIGALEQEGCLSHTVAGELRDAYHLLTRHRILLQIRCLQGEQINSWFLDPDRLSPAERDDLRRALVVIRDLQQVIRTNFTIL